MIPKGDAAIAAQAVDRYWKEYVNAIGEPFRFHDPGGYPDGEAVLSIYETVLSEAENDALEQITKGDAGKTFVTLLTLLAVYFRKYLSKDTIVINVPLLSGRHLVNQDIPVVIGVPGHISLRELLNEVNNTVRTCYHHQDKIIGRREEQAYFSNVLLTDPGMHAAASRGYDLQLSIHRGEETASLLCTYDSRKFRPSFIREVGLCLRHLIAAAVRTDILIRELSILDAGDQEEIAASISRGMETPVLHASVLSLLAGQVALQPSAAAISDSEGTLSYAALDQRTTALATRLIVEHGIHPGDVVGVMVEGNSNLVLALLAVLKCGACYLPVDPVLPAERKKYMADNAGMKLLITESFLFLEQGSFTGQTFLIDLSPDSAEESRISKLPTVSGNDAAYIIYTSGTTGNPKGVRITHRGFVNMVIEQIRIFGTVPADKVLLFASISFDASVSEIFMALGVGAELVLFHRQLARDSEKFVSFLQSRAISVVTLPPSYIASLDWRRLTFLRVIISAGERLHSESALYLSRHLRFFNAYGPTECAVCATINHIHPEMSVAAAESVGEAIGNVAVYILNSDMQVLPAGAIGEIAIGGAGVSPGYIGMPELTAEKFLPDPFSRQPEARFYRTGDLGSMTANGQVLYAGRVDEQIKIRGFRVELGEIEQVILSTGMARQCAVIVKGEKGPGKKIIAFVVPGNDFSEDRLTDIIAQRLPEYMRPARTVVLSTMPVTNSGKIDKKILAGLNERSSWEEEYHAPRSATEEKLAAFWESVLACGKIGRHSNLFKLGADSLTIIRAASFIKDEFSVEIPLELAFQLDHIAALAAYIDIQAPANSAGEGLTGDEVTAMVL